MKIFLQSLTSPVLLASGNFIGSFAVIAACTVIAAAAAALLLRRLRKKPDKSTRLESGTMASAAAAVAEKALAEDKDNKPE